MRNRTAVLGRVLFALLAVPPLGTLLFSGFGYVFELKSLVAHGALTAMLALVSLWLCAKAEGPVCTGFDKILFALFAPLALACALFQLLRGEGLLGVICGLICAVCCIYLSIRHGKPRAIGIVTGALTAALVLFLLSPPGMFMVVMGNIGEETVVRTVPSPDGEYYAEVIDDDQGGLGGSTRVVVLGSEEFNAWLFRVYKKQVVYAGKWGEFDEIEVRWEDEHHLVVKSTVYEIE